MTSILRNAGSHARSFFFILVNGSSGRILVNVEAV